eukprot:c47115_g1_i1 orf=542-2128(-)
MGSIVQVVSGTNNVGSFLEALLLLATITFLMHWWVTKLTGGLKEYRVFGMVPRLLINLHRVHDWLAEMLINVGGAFMYVNIFVGLNGVVTCNADDAEYILKTQFSSFPKGSNFHKNFQELLGDGIFNSDNELWELQRKALSIQFQSRSHRECVLQSIHFLVRDRLLPVLHSTWQKQSTVDLQDVLLRFTFDNICILALGFDPGCLSPNLPEVPFVKAFDGVTEACSLRFALPESIWRFMKVIKVGKEHQLCKAMGTVEQFADEVIVSRRAQMSKNSRACNTVENSDILSTFMQLKDRNGLPYSDKFLRDVAMNIILAGRDSASVSLTWFFWLLAMNPNVEENISQEISKILQNRDTKGFPPQEAASLMIFTEEELKAMHYLHAALSESLRLYPPIPIVVKDCVDSHVLPSGMKIDKGSSVAISIYAMGRMECLWGKDCFEFKPERWLKAGVFMQQSPFKYLVFNAGPRLCLGREMSYIQMKSIAAAIISVFKVRMVVGHPVVQKVSATLHMKHGLLVTLEKRGDGATP